MAVNEDMTRALAICARHREGVYDCWDVIDRDDPESWISVAWQRACEAARDVLIEEQVIARL